MIIIPLRRSIIYKQILMIALVALLSCKPQTDGVDSTVYDLYQESQFANGFALIKNNYGKRLAAKQNEDNYADGIMHASVMFGEMDLLSIKRQVIVRMNEPKNTQDKEGIWRPLYDGIRNAHGHAYNKIDGWVYWIIFNPPVDYAQINVDKSDDLASIAVLTAVSRMNVPYWHNKISSCMKEQLLPAQSDDFNKSWISATDVCLTEYIDLISNMTAGIYPRLKLMPQYQKISHTD